VDGELATLTLSLMQIKLWAHLEGLTADAETDWLQFLHNLSAWSHHLAEVIICHAVNSRNVFLPLSFDFFEHLVRDSDVGATSVDNGGVCTSIAVLLDQIVSILNALTLEGPLLD